MSLARSLFYALCFWKLAYSGSIRTLCRPLLFCSQPASLQAPFRGTLLSEWWNRCTLKVKCDLHYTKVIFFFHYYDFVGIVLKIALSFRLGDVMDMSSASCRLRPGICMPFVDASKGKNLGRSSRTCGRSSGRQTIKPSLKWDQCAFILPPSVTINPAEGPWTYTGLSTQMPHAISRLPWIEF